ncbi:hypothetical protein AMJ80_10675 [bacterium SM23_31]|nr:MAG: hypothetical protein AMJ80_10675 [bacterium SM23_31]
MIDIASLVTLCQSALAGGSKVFEAYRKKKLNKHEEKLLISAADKGQFHLFSVDQIPGTWIRVGSNNFKDDSDPAVAANYLEAFRSLCERGFIVHEGGIMFMLTGTGFEKARNLAELNS